MKRGTIYLVDFGDVSHGPTWEIRKRRPAVVVTINEFNHGRVTVVVVPGTSGENRLRDFESDVRVSPADSGLPKEAVFLTLQIRAVDPGRVGREMGQLTGAAFERLERAIRFTLGLGAAPEG